MCIIKDCLKPSHARGLCVMHYDRWREHGDPLKTIWRPKGSGQIFHGYKLVTINGKQVREHRVIMEQHIGRKLLPSPLEIVHHINGNRLDNRIENLELKTQSMHISHHLRKHFVINGMKICSKCNISQPIINFHKQNTCIDGLKSHCKFCEKKATKLRLSIRFSPKLVPNLSVKKSCITNPITHTKRSS